MGGQGRNVRAALTLWHETIARLSMLIFPLAVFMFIAARDIIALVYTEAYLASVPLFQVSTLAILPMCLCIDAVLRAHAETRALFSLNLARLAFVAILIGWCLATFGLVGAMVATVLATVLARALGLVRIAQIMHVGILDLLPWKRLSLTAAIALASAFPASLARDAVSAPRLIELSITAAVYGAAFLLLWLPESSSLLPATARVDDAGPPLERRLPNAL
jgi:O-antigen/teichoic acid export membrane protein